MCKFKPNAERMVMSMKLLQSEVTEKDTCSCCIYSNGNITENTEGKNERWNYCLNLTKLVSKDYEIEY